MSMERLRFGRLLNPVLTRGFIKWLSNIAELILLFAVKGNELCPIPDNNVLLRDADSGNVLAADTRPPRTRAQRANFASTLATGLGKLQVQPCPQCPSDGQPEKGSLS